MYPWRPFYGVPAEGEMELYQVEKVSVTGFEYRAVAL
jgi:hypothetical protein